LLGGTLPPLYETPAAVIGRCAEGSLRIARHVS
jgi:hypothetical protein